ncbi:MAG: ABC transporter substrate-binding protein, partial [Verrucomicrobia bacterium]|nr:ABC transporter substrate-binding protein [Cytophagales bacterium]
MKKIRIGGVPEHFNMPWHFAQQNHVFEEQGIDLRWT